MPSCPARDVIPHCPQLPWSSLHGPVQDRPFLPLVWGTPSAVPYGGGFAPPSWRGAAGSLLWGPCAGPERPYMCMRVSIPRCVHCCVSAPGAVSPDFCGIEGAEACRAGVSPDALGQPGQHCGLWCSPSYSFCLPSPTHRLAMGCSAHRCWRGCGGKEMGTRSDLSHWESAPVS